LCSQQRIWSHFSKKRGLNRKVGPFVHDGLVQRQFTADRANELRLTAITEHCTDEGKLYLCDQRPLIEPDRRLLDRFEDDRGTRGHSSP
jgi:hypothetical protein